jgi:hypothetical protein
MKQLCRINHEITRERDSLPLIHLAYGEYGDVHGSENENERISSSSIYPSF